MAAKSQKQLPALDEMLCFAVHSAEFAFNQVYRELLRKLGLTYPQYLVMIALWNADNVSVGSLGDQLALDTGTLTPLLKRLEAMGHLSRRRSDIDERRVMIALTEKGRALKHKVGSVTLCIAESVNMSTEKMNRLARDIRALRANLRQAAPARRQPAKRKTGSATADDHQRSS